MGIVVTLPSAAIMVWFPSSSSGNAADNNLLKIIECILTLKVLEERQPTMVPLSRSSLEVSLGLFGSERGPSLTPLPPQHVLELEAKMDQLRALVEAADREKVELLNQLEEEKR